MKKTAVAILIVMACVGLLLFASRIGSKQVATQGSNAQTSENRNESQKQPVEKIEVIHFHATQQCWSCTTVGKYALKTIKEKFPEDYASGKLVFKDINGELSENRDIVIKYQARGSSLFVNAIRSGQDNIEEDVTVWRLVSNENQFVDYFQNKLNKLLGR